VTEDLGLYGRAEVAGEPKLRTPLQTFVGAPGLDHPDGASPRYVFLGAPYGGAYVMSDIHNGTVDGANAVRRSTWVSGAAEGVQHYDFDLAGPVFPDGDLPIADWGDITGDPRDLDAARKATIETVRAIRAAHAVPLVIGGDDSLPPLVVAGLMDGEPLGILHLDAHLDFREEVNGVRDGYSSPIRRLREFPQVREIVQVGLRAMGSARTEEVEAARRAGNVLITAREVHDHGPDWVIERLPDVPRWFVTIDCDSIDPSVTPGVAYPEPDGISFHEAATLVRGVAGTGRACGLLITEYVPSLDLRDLTALTLVRLLMNFMGAAERARQPS
jgi:agmatinase